MKIRTQFLISTVVLGIILLIVSVAVIITNQQVEKTHQQEVLATQIEREAYELGYLANDYLLHRESQQASRWESKFASFSSDLSNLELSTAEQQALLANIRINQQRLKAAFMEVKASIESAPHTQEPGFEAEFMRVSWSRLEVQNQGMIFDASRLTWLLREREDQLRGMTSLLSFVLIGVLGLFLWVNYGLTFRRTLKAIAELQAGTGVIGSGDLDFAIAVKNEDEIGELSRAFNRMTASLKQVTASKADLEKEISERKRTEEALRETEALRQVAETVAAERQRLYGVLESIPAMVCLLTPDYHVPFANRSFRERFGEANDRRCYEYCFGKTEPCEFCESYNVLETGKPHRWECISPDGSVIEAHDFPFTDVDGSSLILEMDLDITEFRKAQAALKDINITLEQHVAERTAELEEMNRELVRSNQNLEQFAYVASHDLQEPLRIMASYSQLLEKRYMGRLDPDANEFIDFIVDAAAHMQKLITDLLAYSRAGHEARNVVEVDCNTVLRRLVAGMAHTIESVEGRVTIDRLPTIMANESSLTQLFQDLIGNAIKFRGEEPPCIHVSARQLDCEWLFSVRDNGIGIEPQYRERIFMIFQRLHPRDKYPGTGIGLSICKKIVETLGGRIWVESELGQGSTFYFTVPIF